MNSATRQHERHMETVAESKSNADRRNKVGKVLFDSQQADHQDTLAERIEDSIFDGMNQTDTQELLHDFGGGISKGPPRGGWPKFDPVTGKRLASGTALSSISPTQNGIR